MEGDDCQRGNGDGGRHVDAAKKSGDNPLGMTWPLSNVGAVMQSQDDGGSPVVGTSPVLRSVPTGSLPGSALDKGDILRLGRLTRGRHDSGGTATPGARSLSAGDDAPIGNTCALGVDLASHSDPHMFNGSQYKNEEFWDNSGSVIDHSNDAPPVDLASRTRQDKFAQLFVRTHSNRSLESIDSIDGNTLPSSAVTATALSVLDDALSPALTWFFRFRSALKLLMETRPFEYFITLVIAANVICLAAMDPLDPDSKTQRMRIIGYFNDAFTVVFVVEMCARMIAEGIFGKKTYFSSNWNCFDAIITILSLADLIAADGSGLGSVKSLRALRGLRALRLISSLKDLRYLVSLLVQCIPMLLNVIALLLFVFLIFGIVGVQLFQGVMRHYCVTPSGRIVDNFRHCSVSDPQSCGANQTCALMDFNPNNGVQSFDNVPAAMMTLFQVLCLQDVGLVIERVQSGTTAYSVYYFLAFTLVGPVVVLNLFLAVIASSFEKSKSAFRMVSSAPNDVNASVTQASTVSSTNDESKHVQSDSKTSEADGQRSSASTEVLNTNRTASSSNELSVTSLLSPFKNIFAFISNKIRPSDNMNVEGAHAVVPGSATGVKTANTFSSFLHYFSALLRFNSRKIIDSSLFGNFMTFVIFLTVLTMAITKSDEPESYYIGLDVANVIYTFCFLLEMILKHIARGFKSYWFDALNAVDGVIVILSCVDAFSFIAQVDSVVGSGISVLRAFRLFRIVRAVKLVRYFPSLVLQIKVLQASLAAISGLCLLISLWIVIFAILGMSIFGGKLVDADTGLTPRLNFDSFLNALLTVFVVFTTEGFPSIFANCAQGAGFGAAIPYFYVLLFVGTFILFNLFVAIIIEEFRSNKSDDRVPKKKNAEKSSVSQQSSEKSTFSARVSDFFSFQDRINRRRSDDRLFYPDGVLCILNSDQMDSVSTNDIAVTALKRMGYCLVGKSMMMFSPLHPFRFWSNTFILNRYFESVVTFFIMLSTVSLGLNGYVLSISFRNGLDIFDTVLLVVFAVELLLKVIASGFVIGEGAYLKSNWNKVDFIVVIAGMIDQIAGIFLPSDDPALNYIRIIRVLRAFRPLRLISRYEGLRIVLRTIAKSIEPVLSTVAILLVAFSIYGILGVQLFMEKFRTCNDSSISIKSNCIGSYLDSSGRIAPREWSSPPLNFDNLANALVCLFILSTQDDWTNFMWQGIDAVSPEEAPVENTNPGISFSPRTHSICPQNYPTGNFSYYFAALALYFVSFMMIGNLLLLNVFVGVFADSYSSANVMMLKDVAARKKFEAPLLDGSPLKLAGAGDSGEADHLAEPLAEPNTPVLVLDSKTAGITSHGIIRVRRERAMSRRLSLETTSPASPLRSFSNATPEALSSVSKAALHWTRKTIHKSNASQYSWVSFVAHAKDLDAKRIGLVAPIRKFILKTSLDADHLRLQLKWLIVHSFFENFISVCIGLSIISMTFDSFQAAQWQNELIEYASVFFTAVFGFEVILKVIALYPREYFADNWNRFDYAVSILALLAFPLEQFSASFNPKVIRAVRLVRVLRSIRIFKFAQGMAQLIQSIVRSFPSVSNLFAIMFLGTFVFAVLGVELFGDMCIHGDDPLSARCKDIDPSYFLSDRANFRNLGNACYVMYRLIISDNWSSIFQTMIVPIPNCQPGTPYNTCGIPLFAPFYFITFVVITTLSLLNILVAIMIYFFDAPDDVNMNLTPYLTKDIFLAVLRRWKRNAMRIDQRQKASLGLR